MPLLIRTQYFTIRRRNVIPNFSDESEAPDLLTSSFVLASGAAAPFTTADPITFDLTAQSFSVQSASNSVAL
jgi:hypothetical protein